MDDRTLLEYAAIAAGRQITWERGFAAPDRIERRAGLRLLVAWNPLADDGDALRLAVDLLFYLNVYGDPLSATFSQGVVIAHDGDPYAATRRAIVTAAAVYGLAVVRGEKLPLTSG